MQLKKRKKCISKSDYIFKIFIMFFAMMLFFLSICGIAFVRGVTLDDFMGINIEKESLGLELVKAMYNFESPYELDANMAVVQEITTSDVFNDITIDNEQRTMLTYLKFKDSPTKISVINSSEDYVHYSIISDAIEPEREFILFFKVNTDGKIYDIEEAECIPFLSTIY